MKLYMLSPNPDIIVMRVDDPPNGQMWIHSEHRLWEDYEVWLAQGNEPDPWTPTTFP